METCTSPRLNSFIHSIQAADRSRHSLAFYPALRNHPRPDPAVELEEGGETGGRAAAHDQAIFRDVILHLRGCERAVELAVERGNRSWRCTLADPDAEKAGRLVALQP